MAFRNISEGFISEMQGIGSYGLDGRMGTLGKKKKFNWKKILKVAAIAGAAVGVGALAVGAIKSAQAASAKKDKLDKLRKLAKTDKERANLDAQIAEQDSVIDKNTEIAESEADKKGIDIEAVAVKADKAGGGMGAMLPIIAGIGILALFLLKKK